MKIVGFLQNPGLNKNDDEYISYCHDDNFRRTRLKYSFTGRRLLRIFGEDLFKKIIWDNATDELGKVTHPDIAHMSAVLINHQPHIVLLFGQLAFVGMKKVIKSCPQLIPEHLFTFPHPNARYLTDNVFKVISETTILSVLKQNAPKEAFLNE